MRTIKALKIHENIYFKGNPSRRWKNLRPSRNTITHTKTCMCLQTRFVGSLDSLKCTIIANTKKEPLEEKETAKSLNIHLINIQI